jgi:tRNA modification GTPase
LDASALVLYLPAPKTVTGEDVLELHVHGGTAVVQAVLTAIPQCNSAAAQDPYRSHIRYAAPGEFTRRAFLNDRLSLPQAEALGDTLAAETEQQRRLAMRGVNNVLTRTYESWRAQLLAARGELEALIDFSEDQHFEESPSVLTANVSRQIAALRSRIELHVGNAFRGELLRNGIMVALLGKPNVGKSSLLNALVRRDAAIVSTEAGTTRDVVEVGIDLGGYFVRFADTAGLRGGPSNSPDSNGIDQAVKDLNAVGVVEKEGILRAKMKALESDVLVVLFSLERDTDGHITFDVDQEVIETAIRCKENGAKIIIAINKRDLALASPPLTQSGPNGNLLDVAFRMARQSSRSAGLSDVPIISISCTNGLSTVAPSSGLQDLIAALLQTFKEITSPMEAPESSLPEALADRSAFQESLGTTERQRHLLEECAAHLDSFSAQVQTPPTYFEESLGGDASAEEVDVVIAAESLRSAADCLARITGRGESGDVEEVLGVVFEK